jgi:homoserine dehydrogenase
MKSKVNSKITIGLFGFGVVGQGLHQVLKDIQTADAEIKKIVVKDPDKLRSVDNSMISLDPRDIIDDPEINLVVELIDDADAAYHIVKQSLNAGKSVVSGNKKMLAYHIEELISIQEEKNVALLYDASACGSIPVIRNLEEYYDNDLLQSITGILNGSSNYILSKIFMEDQTYDEALKKAQELGFAESDPKFDVEGYDSLYKLIILSIHSLGAYVNPEEVFTFGISNLSSWDVAFAKEKGSRIKLVAQVEKLSDNRFSLCVMPRLVTPDAYIYNVEDEYNGVVIQGQFYDKQFMFGKGAGAHPTGSAVLSDITARKHNYRYEYKKRNFFKIPEYTRDRTLKIYLRYQEVADLEHFEFVSISEKYSGPEANYVIGTIKLDNLFKIRELLPKMDVFLARYGKRLPNEA